ncbi:hypothetical protein K7432_015706 [Basidiobolus ranarum]|uniref:Ricin B lectin domain-containing protein n=1 Tax=Basidiobolus ranarum TaxID=34480 RepID=A0ABR2WFR5_9FUNG
MSNFPLNTHFSLRCKDGDYYVGVENNSMDVGAYIVIQKKAANTWDAMQVWYYDEKSQLVNIQTGKIIGYVQESNGHNRVVQKENQQDADFQWEY